MVPKKKVPAKAPATPRPAAPETMDVCRGEIDRIDASIIELLDARARVARRVGEIKREAGRSMFDAGRHLGKLARFAARRTGDFPTDGLRLVFNEIMSACLALEEPQRVAFLGPEATFSHIAAMRAFGRSAQYIPYASFHEIFQAVEKQWVHFGIVPIENSTGGVIHSTLDELMTSQLSICAELHIPVTHNLMCRGSLKGIKKVCTHPQILAQCREWLRANLPDVPQIETSSSAEGCLQAKKNKAIATIGPEAAAAHYKLPILVPRVEDRKDNITRFLIIGHQSPNPSGADKTSIMFSIKDEPGALEKLIRPFSKRGLNLTKIESRPSRKRAWDYIFFMDVEGHMTDAGIVKALEEMRPHTTFLRVLGSYPIDMQGK